MMLMDAIVILNMDSDAIVILNMDSAYFWAWTYIYQMDFFKKKKHIDI